MGQVIVPTLEELRAVLYEFHQEHGYASEHPLISVKNGKHTIVWNKPNTPWRIEDSWRGGEPYGGYIDAFYNENPHWFSGYYGRVLRGEPHKPAYAALRNALRHMPESMPLRGPTDRLFSSGEYRYWCKVVGDINAFSLEEWMERHTPQYTNNAYRAIFIGGLVDQRR